MREREERDNKPENQNICLETVSSKKEMMTRDGGEWGKTRNSNNYWRRNKKPCK